MGLPRRVGESHQMPRQREQSYQFAGGKPAALGLASGIGIHRAVLRGIGHGEAALVDAFDRPPLPEARGTGPALQSPAQLFMDAPQKRYLGPTTRFAIRRSVEGRGGLASGGTPSLHAVDRLPAAAVTLQDLREKGAKRHPRSEDTIPLSLTGKRTDRDELGDQPREAVRPGTV